MDFDSFSFLKECSWFTDRFSTEEKELNFIEKREFFSYFLVFDKICKRKKNFFLFLTEDKEFFNVLAGNLAKIISLDHPNIEKITDYYFFKSPANHKSGWNKNIIMLTTEVEGETLGDILRRGTKLDSEELILITGEILRAIDSAHKIGIVHGALNVDSIRYVAERIGEGENFLIHKYILGNWLEGVIIKPSFEVPSFLQKNLVKPRNYFSPELYSFFESYLLGKENAPTTVSSNKLKNIYAVDLFSVGYVLLECLGASHDQLQALNKTNREDFIKKKQEMIKLGGFGASSLLMSFIKEYISELLEYENEKRQTADYFLQKLDSFSQEYEIITSPQDEVDGIKIIVLGEVSVGKTAILKRLFDGVFQENSPTEGVNFYRFMYKNINVILWDTSGSDKQSGNKIVKMYLGGVDAALIVYSDDKSLMEASVYLELATEFKTPTIGLLKSQIDLTQKIDQSLLKQSILKFGIVHSYECSAFSGQNINFVFEALLLEVFRRKTSSPI